MKKVLCAVLTAACVMTLFTSCAKGGSASGAESKAGADAVQYPQKNINFIVPYSAGGGTDTLMRLLVTAMGKDWGKSIVITNEAGDMDQAGLTDLSKKKNDGYTLGALTNTDYILTLLTGKNVSFTFDDFEYIGAINTSANVLFTSQSSGFQSLDDIVAYGKKNPGKLTVATSGNTQIVEAALIGKATGIKLTPVKQNSGGDSVTALLGGHTDLAILDKNFVKQLADQNAPAIGVLSDKRISTISDVPTMKELGCDVSDEGYRVIAAPKGTSQAIVTEVSNEMKKVTGTPEFQKSLSDIGEVYSFMTPDETKSKLQDDRKKFQEVFQEDPDILE